MTERGKRQFVFVDDSGDAVLRPNFSEFLIFAAVVFYGREEVERARMMAAEFKAERKWKEKDELKFNKLRPKNRDAALKMIAEGLDCGIYYIAIDKRKPEIIHKDFRGHNLYEWALRKLLAGMPLEDRAFIRIDGKYGKKYDAKMKVYLRGGIEAKRLDIKFEDSREDVMIQLADMSAGALNSFVKTGGDKTYYRILKGKTLEIQRPY